MKKALSAIVLSFFALTGCSKSDMKHTAQQKTPQVFRCNIQQEPSSLDPRKVTTIQDINICRAFMDGLYRVDKQGNIQPALAQSHTTTEDGKTYTFYLRDAKWSDGTTITAHDFVYAWKTVLHPSFPSQAAYHLFHIKNAELVKNGTLPSSMLGIQAIDDTTLEITLQRPVHNFASLTAHPVFFPVPMHADKSNSNWAREADSFIASGPFIPKEWKHHYSIIGEKNPVYWDASVVQLDALEMVMVSSETEYTMFEAGELDWVGSPLSSLSTERVENEQARDGVQKAPFLGTKMIRINTKHPLLQSKKVRQALTLATDTRTIAEHVMHGLHDPAFGFVPACMQLHENAESVALNGEVHKLFAEGCEEAGCKQVGKLTLSYANIDTNKQFAEALQEQWRKELGIDVELQALDLKILLDSMAHGKYDLALGSWIADVDSPLNFLEIFSSTHQEANRTGWELDEYAALLDEVLQAEDPLVVKEMLRMSEKLLIENAPIIPITHYSLLYKHKPNVHDVVVTPLGTIDFKWTRVEKAQ